VEFIIVFSDGRMSICVVPGYLSGESASGRTLHSPIARPSSTLVSSASLRASLGSHSFI
jgi:hypothetical protein